MTDLSRLNMKRTEGFVMVWLTPAPIAADDWLRYMLENQEFEKSDEQRRHRASESGTYRLRACKSIGTKRLKFLEREKPACRTRVATGCRRSAEREREPVLVHGGIPSREYCEALAK